MSDVGKRLRGERDRNHLTQVQVFAKTGINNKTLSGYENEVSHPDLESLKTLAKLYGVTTDYLLGENNSAPVDETEIERIIRETNEVLKTAKNVDQAQLMLDLAKNVFKK